MNRSTLPSAMLALTLALTPVLSLQATAAASARPVALAVTADETTTDYPVNYPADATITNAGRSTAAATLTRADGTTQTIEIDQPTSRRLAFDRLSQAFRAKAGEQVSIAFSYTGSKWMNGYVYLDRGQDGTFSTELNADGTPATGSDVMAYTYYQGKNSLGSAVGSGDTGVNPPAFTIPADLKPGVYRLRLKIDWDDIDPAGSTAANNTITKNGGVIIDTRLIIADSDEAAVSVADATGGTLTLADGTALGTTASIGQALSLKLTPAEGYRTAGLRVRHGYGFDGAQTIHGTPQYVDTDYPSYLLPADGTVTLPASVVDGNLLLKPFFTAVGGGNEPAGNDYARAFADDLAVTRTDRHLNSITLTASGGGSRTVTVPALTPNLVYRPLLDAEASALPGDAINVTTDFTGGYMHLYLYVDLNQDGRFNSDIEADGRPTIDGELLSYTYYNGHNSLGETVASPDNTSLTSLPAFTLPAALPAGVYRARLKVDWDNIDPAGRWAEGASNNIDANGGQVVDFLLNVHPAKGRLDILTTDGSVVGQGNSGVDDKIAYGTALSLLPVGATEGYVADKVTIRHGHDLDGAQYVHGNRQWSEYSVSGTEAFTIPADSINGDVRVSATFDKTDATDYRLVFSDEFNGPDGSQPDDTKWNRSSRENPTWKRFVAQTEAGKLQTGYIEDGKFVALCIPNTLDDELDGNGQKQQMISASIESRGKADFLYGKIEGRLKTDPYSGNFPAFWMMPSDQSAGWPYCGEIDIWEQIDAQNISHHTIHTRWANSKADGELCQGQSNNPPKSGQGNPVGGLYHTFGLEWTPTVLKWFVNGKQVFSYAKKVGDTNALNLGQWPFDKAFYIILNQSVGNGSWAAPADVNHTYRTLFDWVRVYQSDALTGLDEAAADETADVYTRPGSLVISAPKATPLSVYDLQGRTVYKQTVQGNVTLSLPQGVYLVGGQKVLVP